MEVRYGNYNGLSKNVDDEEEMVEAVPKIGLSFKDDRHTNLILHSLNMMRKNRTFCDVVLHVGNSEVYGHRAVLGSASPYLLEMFTTDDDKGIKESVIAYKLNGAFERTALEKLIDYAYTAKLELAPSEVRPVFVAATQLKMERVAKECAATLINLLSPESAVDIRSLPGIARDATFLAKVDQFIASRFEEVRESAGLLSLPCAKIEVLQRCRGGVSLLGSDSLCRLALDWAKSYTTQPEALLTRTHLLFLAVDNSLQDCSELPPGDASETQIVQDYKRTTKALAQTNKKGRKSQPAAKPRMIIYNRDIPDSLEEERYTDWKLIASAKVAEHSHLGLATMEGKLWTLSVVVRARRGGDKEQAQSGAEGASGEELGEVEEESGTDPDLGSTYCGLASMGAFKCGAGCANLNDNLLVCGGYDRAECLRSVELYSPSLNTWASLAPMLEARGRFNIAVVEGAAYAVGGCNGTTELSTVECLRLGACSWERVASLPMPRSNIGVCSLKGKIYCIGGWNGQVGIRQCDVFDPSTETWTSMPPLQTGRYQAGVCAMGGDVWVVGGCDGWNCLNTVEVLSPPSSTWTYAPHMITPRRGSGLAYFKGKLFVVGGSDGTQSLSTTEIYDPVEKSWTTGPSMSTPRSNVGVAVIGARLYAVGGFSGKTFLNSIEYLDEVTEEWTTFSPKFVDPAEEGGEAKDTAEAEAGGGAGEEVVAALSALTTEERAQVSKPGAGEEKLAPHDTSAQAIPAAT